VPIGTLNYDNVIETFAVSVGIPCGTGLQNHSGFSPTIGYSFEPVTSGFELFKLHGSLNWTLHGAHPFSGVAPTSFVVQRSSPPDYSTLIDAAPALLFGESKLTAEGPFLQLLFRFRQALRRVRRLTIVGYSFRDAHINEQIIQFVNEQRLSQLSIIDPFSTGLPPLVRDLTKHCRERVTLLQTTAGKGLAEVFGAA
jgi:hypothetical protein